MLINENTLMDINTQLVDYLGTFVLLEKEVKPCFLDVDIFMQDCSRCYGRGLLNKFTYAILNNAYMEDKKINPNSLNLDAGDFNKLINKEGGAPLYTVNNNKNGGC